MRKTNAHMVARNNPIGVFDSGLGGLTVMSQIMRTLPHEDIVYFGDTARIPYGSKSKDVVIKYAKQIARYLMGKRVKLIIVACNTASSYAIPALIQEVHVPVVGVIQPGAKAAMECTDNNRIGIIGTEGTIKSGSYVKALRRINRNIKTYSHACPLFVPLVENGWLKHRITYAVIEEYCKPLKKSKIDTLILGCTHYPLIKEPIQKVLGKKVTIVDSASSTARDIAGMLHSLSLDSLRARRGKYQFYVSDAPEKFKQLGQRFLGKAPMRVKKTDLGE